MPRKPVVVPKSARSIPPQVINEEPGPDGNVSGYCPHSGPYGLRHRAIPLQGQQGGDYRSDRGRSATQATVSARVERSTTSGTSGRTRQTRNRLVQVRDTTYFFTLA